jgi:tetratricopeptide (TPR) repeat protein
MKLLSALTLSAAVVGGSYLVATGYARPSQPPLRPAIHLEPVVHAPFDPAAIARNIAFHQGRVRRDPQGAIGWAMLADAYLAESREYDRDTAAWNAEVAARKSLALRTRGNERGKAALVSSLLEQHRFQDALRTLDGFGVKQGRLRADVLIELGRYEEAKRLIARLRPEDPSASAAWARIALVGKEPDLAIKHLLVARKLVDANPGIAATTLAWYDVKLGDAYAAAGCRPQARERYRQAVVEHARSYKAHLALARLSLAERNWKGAIAEGQATLRIANSLDARAVIGDAYAGLGRRGEAEKWYASCYRQFREEVAAFDRLGRGGPLRVRPIDRQFATFAAAHRRYTRPAVAAAKRDLANRPDPHARQTLRTLVEETTER